MSADYQTKDFKAYHHDCCIWVTWKGQGEPSLGAFTEDTVRQLQSLISQWKANQ